MGKSICLDFDGVLHSYITKWERADLIPDSPVPGAVEFVQRLVADGWKVYVQSVRAVKDPLAIHSWLHTYGFPVDSLFIVSEKPKAWVYLDDRAWCFRGVFPTIAELERFNPWNRTPEAPRKTLIATVGLPRAGKSTWARAQGYPIVNPDSIRLALHGQRFAGVAEPFVWAIAKCMVRALFLAGHDTVVLDATNITQARRDEWVSRAWDTVWHVIGTNPDLCKRRAVDAGMQDLLPVIDRMAEQWDYPGHVFGVTPGVVPVGIGAQGPVDGRTLSKFGGP